MDTNRRCPNARHLSNSSFPSEWVWNPKERLWTPWKRGTVIGRIYFTHPTAGEKFYMCVLPNFVKCCTSFKDIHTVDGTTYSTYKQACYVLGLLDDDNEWVECLAEASNWASGHELRRLFVTLLIHCQVTDTVKLWSTHYEILSEDIAFMQRSKYRASNLQLTDQQIEAFTLFEIEKLMTKMGKSLWDYDGMPLPNQVLMNQLNNPLINEKQNYCCDEQKRVHATYFSKLNECQLLVYKAILMSINNDVGDLIFVQGRGGTGKTFLWNAVVSKLRSEGKIVLPIASSGIASLLLPNGRTAHSRFQIPVDLTVDSTCDIKNGTNLAKLLQHTSLIIWDKAPMAHKHCFGALDRSLRDIMQSRYECSAHKLFGGLTIVCGGDFRQILPVVPKGSRADIVHASLNSSYLWQSFTVYELTQNMRLTSGSISQTDATDIAMFDSWMLKVWDGSYYDYPRDEMICIPSSGLIHQRDPTIVNLIHVVYPSLLSRYRDLAYLMERVILAPRNDVVQEINEATMDMLPGDGRTYRSSDTVCKGNMQNNSEDLLYPIESLVSRITRFV